MRGAEPACSLCREEGPLQRQFGAFCLWQSKNRFPERGKERSETRFACDRDRFAVKIPADGLWPETNAQANFALLAEQRVIAVVIGSDPLFIGARNEIIALAARQRIPAIYPFRADAEAGGLVSYGPDNVTMFHMAGGYTGRILRGEKIADLPVQQITKVLDDHASFGQSFGRARVILATSGSTGVIPSVAE